MQKYTPAIISVCVRWMDRKIHTDDLIFIRVFCIMQQFPPMTLTLILSRSMWGQLQWISILTYIYIYIYINLFLQEKGDRFVGV